MTRSLTSLFILTLVLLTLDASPSAFQSRDAAVVPPGHAIVQGRVVTDDEAARPVRGAIVTISGVAPSYSRLTATDDQGRFLLAALPAGDVTVTAAKPGYLTSYYGARRPGRGPAVPLWVGDGPRGSDITIRLMHGGAIAGTIFGLTGRPQAGVLVTPLQSHTVNGQRTLAVPAGSQGGFTDDQGRYRIWGLAPGDYIITAAPPATLADARSITDADLQWAAEQTVSDSVAARTAPPRAPNPGRTVSYAPVFYPGGVDPARAVVITLGPAEERAGVDLTLQIVSTATVSGTVLGLSGQPVPNVQVMLASTASLGTRGRTGAETDANGHFAFRAVAPGEFTVTARAPSSPPGARSAFDLWASRDLTVNGEDQDGLALTLRPGMTVSGRVLYKGTTKPPEDLTRVLIHLTPASSDSGVAMPSQEPASADGTFALSGIAPGRYRLSALLSNLRGTAASGSAPWFLKSALWNGQDILDDALEVAAGQDVNELTMVFVDRQTDLSGTLVDTVNHPVADEVLVVFPTDRRLWTPDSRRIRQSVLGSDGHFRVVGLPAGEYYLGAITRADAVDVDLSDTSLLEEVARVAVRTTLAEGEQKVQNLRLGGT